MAVLITAIFVIAGRRGRMVCTPAVCYGAALAWKVGSLAKFARQLAKPGVPVCGRRETHRSQHTHYKYKKQEKHVVETSPSL